MSKHPNAGTSGDVDPPNDLERDPRIGQSKGTTATGIGPDEIAGENTFEGDDENDVTSTGGVNPNQQGRTNK